MGVVLESNAFFMGIEYLAVFFCGIMGGLSAIRRGYDLFSIVIIAWLTALGGGILRDVLLGDLPPVGISDRGFVLTALAAGLVAAFAHPEVERMNWTMLIVDALAVGLFAVNGTAKALGLHTSGMTAVFMGMFTALGGGLIRDTLLNEVPMVIRDRHWYAVPTAVGCVLTVVVFRAAQRGAIGLRSEMLLDVANMALVVALRALSVVFPLTPPGPVHLAPFAIPSHRRSLPPSPVPPPAALPSVPSLPRRP